MVNIPIRAMTEPKKLQSTSLSWREEACEEGWFK